MMPFLKLILNLRPAARSLLLLLIVGNMGTQSQAFVFDSFGDGFWKIVNQANGSALVVSSNSASQATASTTAEQQQFQALYNLDNATFRIRTRDSWFCIGALNGAATNGTAVVTINYVGLSSQQWNLVDVGGGYYRILNAASGLALQTDGGLPAQVKLATVAANTQQYWRFDYQTHYPKKGTAGYDGSWEKFGASWSYNWGRFGADTPPQVAFAPMQWGQWWPNLGTLGTDSVAWRQSAKPQYLLGFNEPDSSSQANVSVATAISLWPQLQAANVPLVSPATVNPRNTWDNDFFNQIASNNYRVDYKAIHWYGSPNASSLINTLQSSYTAHGRPIWLTEFSTVDWNGTATWTEEDNYRFLAEFMWRAEDLAWLKRYAIFSFSGTPSASPWDRDGHRSDVFESNGYTFTPFGELYATWDGDRTLRERTPYLIHNLSTSHELGSSSASTPSPKSIRVRDATAQWGLLAAPTSNRWYIVSLRDGRRLRTDGTTIDLAPPNTAGTNLEWSFNGPDSTGYYFIDNQANSKNLRMDRVDNSSGAPTSITLSMYPFGNASDQSRWRFIKPYQAVPVGPPAAVTNLTAESWDRMVVLRWSGDAPRYNVYRSTTSGGPYARISTDVADTLCVDNSVQNGTAYFYVIAALNGLEEESTYSNESTTTPTASASNRLVAVYKFEGNAQDSSGNSFQGTVTTDGLSYGAGRADAKAATFTGSAGGIQIPSIVANDFSIAFWMKTTAVGASGQWWAGLGIVDGEVSGINNDFGITLVSNKIAFGVGNPDTTITSTSSANDGLWHHVVATRASNGALRLYVDGVLQSLGVGPSAARSAPPKLTIGSLQSGSNPFTGSIDEVRFYNYVLATGEITKLAKRGATMVASYQFEGTVLDMSGEGNHGIATNITFTSGVAGTQAAQFDGAGSYIKIPASIADEFSISLWAKTTTTAGSPQWWSGKGLVDGEVSGATSDFGVALVANRAAFGVGNPDTTIVSTTPISDGQWHHVVATRSGANGMMKLYLDGNLQSSTTGPTGSRSSPPALRIGGILAGGGYFSGTVDDVRLFNYALAPGQVSQLYNPQPLPSPWQSIDIGNPWSIGYAAWTSNNWTLGGGGSDIWQTSDQFRFAYQSLSGPGNITARVGAGAIISDGTTNIYAKAGIMFRDSATADSPFVAVFHTQGQGIQMVYRDTYGASAGQLSSITINPPVWLKLIRSGNGFSGFYATTVSPTTNDWVGLGMHTTTIASNALVGLVACSHDNTKLANASYTSVALVADTPANLWRVQWFGSDSNSGNGADFADPDGDGINNLWERAFNLNPLAYDTSGWPTGGLDGADCILSYRRSLAATDLSYQPQWSTNLIDWSASNITDGAIQTNAQTETRIARLPHSTGNPLFIRLRLLAP